MSVEAPSVLQNLRRQHTLLVMSALTSGPQTRRELESAVGLSRTTLSAIIGDLLSRTVVTQDEVAQQGVGRSGRPTKALMLNPELGAAIGIELGRDRVAVVALGFDGSAVGQRLEAATGAFDLQDRLRQGQDLIEDLMSTRIVTRDALLGVGLGLAARHADPAALCDTAEQRQRDPAGLSLEPLRDQLNVPLMWDNNVRLAAVAESIAAGSTGSDLMYIALSAGVSCGLVVNGGIVRGGGTAGELGHVSVDPAGPPCWCGGRGCLEGYVSSDAVLARAREHGLECSSLHELDEAALSDRDAQQTVRETGVYLGHALVNAAMLLDPQRLVIGGELAVLGEPLLMATRDTIEAQGLNIGGRRRAYSLSRLGPAAAGLGAARMALRQWGGAEILF